MKQKLVLVFTFLYMLSAASYAQINKGAIWLGGSIAYGGNKYKNDQLPDGKIREFNITPAIGSVIKDNLVAGIFVNYGNKHTQNVQIIAEETKKTYGGGLFIRRYVPVFKRFYFFGEGRLGYSNFKTDDKWAWVNYTDSFTTKGWATNLSFTPGISYGIAKNIQLEAGANALFKAEYGKANYIHEVNGYTSSSQKSFSAGINLENESRFFLGIRFLLNNKS